MSFARSTAGSHQAVNPCRDCPEDDKKEARFADEQGKVHVLCAQHAVEAGTLSARHPISGVRVLRSMASAYGGAHPSHSFPSRVRYRRKRGGGSCARPQVSSRSDGSGVVWHPKHSSAISGGRWGPDVYAQTMQQMEEYKAAGLKVHYVWSCEYEETYPPYPRALRTVVHASALHALHEV